MDIKAREHLSKVKRKHGHANNRVTGAWASTTYRAWTAMISRCYDRKARSFQDYGARGITVCGRWLASFEAFFADMGERPKRLTLERINNDLGYSPENCRWASYYEQAHNTRRTKSYTFNGVTMCESEWGKTLGISHSTLRGRIDRGWPIAKALTLGVLPKNGKDHSTAHLIEFNGEIDTVTSWARRCGLNPFMVFTRLRNGWTVGKALTEKKRGS